MSRKEYYLKFYMVDGMGKPFIQDHNRNFEDFKSLEELWDYASESIAWERAKEFYTKIVAYHNGKWIWEREV